MKKIIFLLAIIASFTANAGSVGVLKYSEYGSHTTDLASRISTGDFSPANCTADEYVRFVVQFFSEKLPKLEVSTTENVQWMVENSEVVMMPLSDYDKLTTPRSCKNSVVENGTMKWSDHLRPLSSAERIKYKDGVPFASYEGLIWLNFICWNIVDLYQSAQTPTPVPYQGEGASGERGAIVNNYTYVTNEGQTVVYQQEATGYQNGYTQSWGSPSGVNVSFWFSYGNYGNSCQQVQSYCAPPVQCLVQPVQTCVPYQQCPTSYLWQNLHSNVYAGCTTTPVHDNGGNGPNGDSDGDLPGNGPSKTIYQGNHPKTETVTDRSFEVPKGITSASNGVSQSGVRPSVKPSFENPVKSQVKNETQYYSPPGTRPGIKPAGITSGSNHLTSDVRPNNSFVSPIKNPGVRPGKEVSTNNSSSTQPSRANNMVKGNNNGTTSYVAPPRTKNNANYTSGPRQTSATEQSRPQNSVNNYSAPRPRANAQQARPRNNSSQMARGNTGSRPSAPSAPMARGGVR